MERPDETASARRAAQGAGEQTAAPRGAPAVSRRAVLRTGMLAGAAAVVATHHGDQARDPTSAPATGNRTAHHGDQARDPTAALVAGNLTAHLIRREDQLSLRFEFVNLTLVKAGGQATLVRQTQGLPAYVVVHLGAQAIGEETLDDVDEDFPPTPTPPLRALPAGPTRLAFVVPDDTHTIPYTVDGLMAWHRWEPSVVPTALDAPPGNPAPVEPGENQTAIEAPRALILSPPANTTWVHNAPSAGRTELWHTRLAVVRHLGIDETDPDGRTVRAVWTPGFQRDVVPPDDPDDPPADALSRLNRYELVRLTSDRNIAKHGGGVYVPQPVQVERLALSPLGATLSLRGAWPEVEDIDIDHTFALESWIHRATLGRDTYVRVMERGFLLPGRHTAVWMEVTERKFGVVHDPGGPQDGRPVAYLSTIRRLVPRGPTRAYPEAAGHPPFGGREWPFTSMTILARTSPRLMPPETDQILPGKAFWPRVSTGPSSSEDFRFPVEAVDRDGRAARMLMPMVFVSVDASSDKAAMEAVIAAYEADPQRVTTALHGQEVALAAFPGGVTGECSYPLADITFGASLPDPPTVYLEPFAQPRFHPRMRRARARLDSVERITGGAYGPREVTPHPAWLTGTGNSARLFARVNPPVDLAFGADACGGVATPSMRVTGLSARTGPVGGDVSGPQAPATFDPAAFFAGAAPKILGGISLLDLLDVSPFGADARAPRLVTVPVPGGVETSLTWTPTLKSTTSVIVLRPTSTMTLRASTTIRDGGAAPTTRISGELTDFSAVAVGDALKLCTVDFRRLAFTSANGGKPEIDADITDVHFHGVLEFVSKLQEFVETTNGSVEVTTAGIRVGYDVALPPVPLGMFSLENVSVGASIAIPFDDRPARVRFAFAERDRPFMLTVAIFGGGGFVGVSFGLDEFELFEAALEFGAKFALDVGVASGGVSAIAGVYLAIGASGGELTGFLRLNGELEVLGLVHLAIEFYLGFTYDFAPKNEVWGEASITVEVDVLLFSGSVTLGPVRKRFAGGSGASSAAKSLSAPPDLFSPPQWDAYRAQFAPSAFG